MTSARAIATRCCWPPDSWCGYDRSFSGQAHAGEQLARPLLGLAARDLLHPARPESEVVHHAQVREEVELLEDDADPLPDLVDLDASLGDLLALEEDPPALDRLQQVDRAEQRALAAPARADDDEGLARGHLEVDAVEDEVVAEALVDLLAPDDRSPRWSWRRPPLPQA